MGKIKLARLSDSGRYRGPSEKKKLARNLREVREREKSLIWSKSEKKEAARRGGSGDNYNIVYHDISQTNILCAQKVIENT